MTLEEEHRQGEELLEKISLICVGFPIPTVITVLMRLLIMAFYHNCEGDTQDAMERMAAYVGDSARRFEKELTHEAND